MPTIPDSKIYLHARQLASDGRLDKRDVNELVDMALEDGQFDESDKQALKQVDVTFRKHVFDGGTSKKLVQWYAGGIQDSQLAIKARQFEKSGGRVSQQESRDLLALAASDGVTSPAEVVTIRAFLLGGVQLTKPAQQTLLQAPHVIRPYERSDLLFRPHDPVPTNDVVERDGSIQLIEESHDDGWTTKEIRDGEDVLLARIDRTFSEQGALTSLSLDRNGDGTPDEVQTYRYKEGRLAGVTVFPASGNEPNVATEISYTYDDKGNITEELRQQVANPQNDASRDVLSSTRALHVFDPATKTTTIRTEGAPRPYEWAPALVSPVPKNETALDELQPPAGSPTGMIVEEEKTIGEDGRVLGLSVKTVDKSKEVSTASSKQFDKHNQGNPIAFMLPKLPKSEKTKNDAGLVLKETYKNEAINYEYNDKGLVTQATYTSGKDASDPDKQISVKYTYDDQDRLLSEAFVRKDKVGTELSETHLSAQHSWPANGEHHIDVRDKEGLMSRRVHMLPSGQFSLHEDFSEGKRIRGEYYQYDEKGEILEGKEVIEGEDGLFSRTETFQYDPASGHLLEVEIREHERDKLTQTEPVLASLTREIFRGDEAQTLLSRTQTSENAARIVGVMDKPTHTGNLHNPDQVKTSLHSTETFRYNDQGEFLEKEHLIQETYAHF